MTERGIIMSAPNIRPTQDGSKTQTRRNNGLKEVNRDPGQWRCENFSYSPALEKECAVFENTASSGSVLFIPCPYGVAGDRLWVRETHAWADYMIDSVEREDAVCVAYRADKTILRHESTPPARIDAYAINWEHKSLKWRPSIHLPRWASRITLELTGVRVERLQDISTEDVKAEGLPLRECRIETKLNYHILWDSLHGKGAWDLNPWVWVLEFKRL